MPDSFATLAELIQISVAPVFLLTGIAGLLSVMTQRLGRIIDRMRALREGQGKPEGGDVGAVEELATLQRRVLQIHRAITLCTYSALLVSAVIAALFLGALLDVQITHLVAVVFVAAMLLLIGGLASFLTEVHLTTRYIRQSLRG